MYVIKSPFKHNKFAYYQPDIVCLFVDKIQDAKKFKTIKEAKKYYASGNEKIVKI